MWLSTFITDCAGHAPSISARNDSLRLLFRRRLLLLARPSQTGLPDSPRVCSPSPRCLHRARNAPRPSCSSLVASRQAPNLPRTTTNENPRTLPFHTRFRAPSGHARQSGGEDDQLPDLDDDDWRSSFGPGRYAVLPGSNLVPTSAKRLLP